MSHRAGKEVTAVVIVLRQGSVQWSSSTAEGGLLARGNNNAEQAVRDHRRSVEDSFVHDHYWSPSVVTGERKEEEEFNGHCAEPMLTNCTETRIHEKVIVQRQESV